MARDETGMDKLQPWMRWLALAAALCALAIAFVAPHRPDAIVAPDDSPPPALASPAPSPSIVASPSPSQIAVYVCGAVRKAGVYRLPAGARVVDAVNQAGGLSGDADPEAINLAQPLNDGMKVDVPKKGAVPQDGSVAVDLRSTGRAQLDRYSAHATHHGSRAGSHKLAPGQTLDLNTATESELIQLPGVGPSLARRIVEYREANGPFQTLDDLQNVSGIGASKFAKMEQFLRL